MCVVGVGSIHGSTAGEDQNAEVASSGERFQSTHTECSTISRSKVDNLISALVGLHSCTSKQASRKSTIPQIGRLPSKFRTPRRNRRGYVLLGSTLPHQRRSRTSFMLRPPDW